MSLCTYEAKINELRIRNKFYPLSLGNVGRRRARARDRERERVVMKMPPLPLPHKFMQGMR